MRRLDDVVAAAARQPPSSRVSSRSGAFVNEVPVDASQVSRSCFVIAWPVRSPTCSSRFLDAPPQRASR